MASDPAKSLNGRNSPISSYDAAKESNLPSRGLPGPASFEDWIGHQARAAPGVMLRGRCGAYAQGRGCAREGAAPHRLCTTRAVVLDRAHELGIAEGAGLVGAVLGVAAHRVHARGHVAELNLA